MTVSTVMFNDMTNRQYAGRTKYYGGEKAKLEVANFWDYVANALARYYDCGDPVHLTNMVNASLAVGRYRSFVRVCRALSAHPFNTADKSFTHDTDGNPVRADKAKLRNLQKIDDETLAIPCPVWEVKLTDYMKKENEHAEKTPSNDWSAEQAVLRLIKKAVAEDKPLGELETLVHKAIKETKAEIAEQAKREADSKTIAEEAQAANAA